MSSIEPNSDPQPRNLPQSKFRVNQLDALMLDDEISSIIKHWIGSALSLLDGRLKLRLDQSILWCADVVCRYIPMIMLGGTFAMDMQGLHYNGHIALKLAYIVLASLLTLTQDRIPSALTRLMKALNLTNYLVFIRHGKYPTFLHRLLQLEMIPVSRDLTSGVDFEFMHRQLVWQALTEFSLVVVPWIRTSLAPGGLFIPIKIRISRILGSPRRVSLPEVNGCLLCHHKSPAMAKTLKLCGHTFCYYCITDWQQRNTLECPVCSL